MADAMKRAELLQFRSIYFEAYKKQSIWYFFSARSNFISLIKTKHGHFTSENTAFGVNSVKWNSILHWKNQMASIYQLWCKTIEPR